MTKLTPGSDTSAALGKAFKPHGFHDACDLLVIDQAEIRITVEARSDAFSTIKPVLIIEGGLDFCTNKGIGTHL